MKYAKIAGLCLVALLLMGMAAAATASATPHWEACEKGAAGTKYKEGEHEQCEEASGTGEWGWAEIKGTEKSVSRGTITIVQEKVPVVETVEIACTVLSEGSVGPGKYSRIEKTTYTCKAGKNCETLEKALTAKNLPWQEELYETESSLDSNDTNGKSGTEAPGWTFTCKVLGAEDKDEINGEKIAQTLKSARSGFLFLELLELADPTIPESRKGSLGFLLSSGNGLRATPLGPG